MSKANPNSKGGKLWSEVVLDDMLDSCQGNLFSTNIDARKNNGLEGRGSEQYLTELVSRKPKNFVAPAVLKAKVRFRGRGHGRGMPGRMLRRSPGGRGHGRGHGRIPCEVEVVIGAPVPVADPAEIDISKITDDMDEDMDMDVTADAEEPTAASAPRPIPKFPPPRPSFWGKGVPMSATQGKEPPPQPLSSTQQGNKQPPPPPPMPPKSKGREIINYADLEMD